ncbi:hypothetical protein AAFF_G00050160 [Aldrovandia affinis]|uniref:CARD domain-containing protein n=1 Tax=Aldrovandia affinis TaxID=143900 RepID=A0AAD7R297_9TELE|nr:hypothetical protein AAFF_G00050160 [Aldrovandia affinis]
MMTRSVLGLGASSVAGMGDTGGSASDSSVTQTEAGQHFVKKHGLELINRVTMVKPILDKLLHKNLINYDKYEFVKDTTMSSDQMRRLLYEVIYPGGRELKDELYRILKENEPALMRDLEGSPFSAAPGIRGDR